MPRSFNEIYLEDVKRSLAGLLDYSIADCLIKSDEFSKILIKSNYHKNYESADPWYISGKSSVEIAQLIFREVGIENKLKKQKIKDGYTKEYWAGYYLAYFQWKTCISYKELFKRLSLSKIIDMYPLYHEMDEDRFCEDLINKLKETDKDTNLKRIREMNGYSQSELAELSGVGIRNIQLYEQRKNDINKASAQNLLALSLILHCEIIDLMEFPISD